jgi:signal transduction histidine kinase
MVRIRADDQFLFLGHIAARMAHEMRRPLHIVQLAAQSLRSQSSSREKYLNLIDQEITNADRFIREILNFVRPEQLNLSRYPLQSLVVKTVRKYQLVAQEHHILLSYEADDSLPPFYFDVLRMDEVVSNLLQNAIEAVQTIPEHERTIHVRVSAEPQRGVVLTVTDSGPGFDEQTIERAMDPYFTTKPEGTGIGLSLCYRILTAHGAQLLLDNTAEHHGRAQVVFPL